MYTYNLVIEGFCGIAPSIQLQVFVDGKLEYDLAVEIFHNKDDESFVHTAQRMVRAIENGQVERMQNYQDSLVP